MSGDLQAVGMRELRRDLHELPKRLARKVMRRSTRRGAVVLQKAIRKRTPVRTEGGAKRIVAGTEAKGLRKRGFGRKNIRVFERRERGALRDTVFRYAVAPSRKAFYLAFKEFGTKHQRADPFIEGAVDEAEPAAFKEFADSLEAGMDEELTKLGWR